MNVFAFQVFPYNLYKVDILMNKKKLYAIEMYARQEICAKKKEEINVCIYNFK